MTARAATAETFFDTNVVLYLLSADKAKADRAEDLLAKGGTISVQVLNELVAVARGKLRMPWHAVLDVTTTLRSVCAVVPVTLDTHDRGLAIAENMGLSVYDSMIVAAALTCGASVLYSEDLRHGRVVGERLTIQNPFRQTQPPTT
ncbi:MAG: PIN domain-containing protein [Burkholderiales bacterium]|nr:PIN domain-containing protein [Burkholderiales bacterium]